MKEGEEGRPSMGRSDDSPDEALARRVRAGDRGALESLVRRHVRAIHAVSASYLSEPADVDDAVQETFLRAIRNFRSYDTDRPFAPWLYQIARNVARARLGESARRRDTSLDTADLPAAGADPAVAAERKEMREMVEIEIRRLPEQRRTAFRLVDVEGYSTAEVARLMGLSDGTVRSHVHHARRALRAALAPRLVESPKPESNR